jgi:hypothetical protein
MASAEAHQGKWSGNRRAIGEDFFETPPHAVLPVLKYIPEGIKTIWEPTNGKDGISKHLGEYNVIKTDLFPKTDDTQMMDFLTDEPEQPYDFILFNPPWSLKTQFLQRALALGKPFMFICPITILETATRSALFAEHRLSIINLSNRINYAAKNGVNKVHFHSVWVLHDGQGRIHYEKIVCPRYSRPKPVPSPATPPAAASPHSPSASP